MDLHRPIEMILGGSGTVVKKNRHRFPENGVKIVREKR